MVKHINHPTIQIYENPNAERFMFFCEVKGMDRINVPVKNKFGYYEIWYKVKGRWNKISCKTKDRIDAIKYFADFEEKFKERRQGYLFESDFDSAVKLAMNAKHNISDSTKDNYKLTIRKLKEFRSVWDKTKNPDFLNAFINSLFDTKLSPAYISMIQSHIIQLVKIAKRQGSLAPTYEFEPLKIHVPKTKTLEVSQTDFDILYGSSKDKNFKNLMAFLYFTGLRISDVCNLKWDDIDFEKKQIRIKQIKTKNPLWVPLLDVAFFVITELKKERISEFVFMDKNKKWDRFSAKNRLRALVLRVFGKNKYHLHSFRHGFAQTMFSNQIPIEFVKEFMGHASIQTTLRYVDIMKELQKQLVHVNESIKKDAENITEFNSINWN